MSQAWDPPSGQPFQSWQPAAPYAAAFDVGPRKKTDGGAVFALVLAIVSFVVWFVPAIVAIFVASGAKRNTREVPELRKGEGLALAAQVVSAVSIVLSAGILALISFF